MCITSAHQCIIITTVEALVVYLPACPIETELCVYIIAKNLTNRSFPFTDNQSVITGHLRVYAMQATLTKLPFPPLLTLLVMPLYYRPLILVVSSRLGRIVDIVSHCTSNNILYCLTGFVFRLVIQLQLICNVAV